MMKTSRNAIVDRVLERGRFLTLDGPSMRTKHLGIDDPTTSEGSHIVVNQPARISGIDTPEFPEPTLDNRGRPRRFDFRRRRAERPFDAIR